MDFILFRHGEKIRGVDRNPTLSPFGLRQAEELASLVSNGHLPKPTNLWVSPKIRTHQTLAPTSQLLQIPLVQREELEEKQLHEATADFRSRIKRLLAELEQDSGCVFICTHMDWTEEAMSLITCDQNLSSGEYSYWAPAQYLSFRQREGYFELLKAGVVKGELK